MGAATKDKDKAPAQAGADTPADAGADTPTPTDAGADTRPPEPVEALTALSRSDEVREQSAGVVDPRERYVLAPALDGSAGVWHKTPDGGHIAVTRATVGDGDSAKVRDFITYVPGRGRVAGIPLFALDAHPEIGV